MTNPFPIRPHRFSVVIDHYFTDSTGHTEEVALFVQDSDAERFAKWLAGDIHNQASISDSVIVSVFENTTGNNIYSSGELSTKTGQLVY